MGPPAACGESLVGRCHQIALPIQIPRIKVWMLTTSSCWGWTWPVVFFFFTMVEQDGEKSAKQKYKESVLRCGFVYQRVYVCVVPRLYAQ